MTNIRTALLYSSLNGYGIRLIGLISVVLVARLLTPAELGVYAIVASLTLVASELKTLGAGSFLIKKGELTSEVVQSALGLMVVMCWGFAFCLFLMSGFIEDFYGIPDLANLFKITTVSFLVAPFVSVTRALLSRKYDFGKIFVVSFFPQLAILLMTLFFLYRGYSYFALAYASALGAVFELLITIPFKTADCSWRPSFRNMKPIASFGIFVSVANLFRKFSIAVPDIVIGKIGTPSQVALFSRGIGFLDFSYNSLLHGFSGVALPYLSAKRRSGESLEAPYLKATMLLGAIVWPVLAVAGVVAHPAIMVFFGDQWVESVVLVKYLSFWMIFRSVHSFLPQLFMSLGKEKLILAKEMVIFAVIASTVIISFEAGLEVVASNMVFAGLADLAVGLVMLKVCFNFSIKNFILAALSNIIIAVICFCWASLLDYFVVFSSVNSWYALLLVGGSTSCVWLVTVFLTKNLLAAELLDLMGKLRPTFK